MLLHRKARSRSRLAARRAVPATLSLALLGCMLPAAASAAATPQAVTECSGVLTRAPTSDEPNTLAYQIHCSNAIGAYTLLVNRQQFDFTELDDFSSDVSVVDGAGNTVTSESFLCEGAIPGAGVNCNGNAAAGHYVEGTIDTVAPYCSAIPAGSPAGTLPDPQAVVQLIVSDTTGAEDGPFRLNLSPLCPPAPKPKPKAAPKAKTKSKHKAKTRHARKRA